MDILKDIQKDLPKVISSANFEGANIVFYTNDLDFFKDNNEKIKELVNKFKKRIELRADPKLLKTQEETEKIIRKIVPEEAGLEDIFFDPQRAIVVIEAKRPGLVIGKSGLILKEIKEETHWIPQIQRSPAIKSKITENIRAVLYQNNNTRKRFLNSVGKKIYKEWNPEKMDEWIRITILGGGRQVGRSCLLLQTPQTKILLDCGVDVAAKGKEKFPYLDISEFKLNELDAILLSHAHLDHCLPPESLVLTESGYKPIKDLQVGERVISLDWRTGKYVRSKCTEKTKTAGHEKIFIIKTPYSQIESSPNHRFFTFENLELKELRADELEEGTLLPSNILHKPKLPEKKIQLDTDIEYDIRRKDNIVLPKILNSQLSEFIGYFAGDGHKSSDFSLRLTDSSLQILNRHKNIIKNLFNHDAKIRHHSDKTKNAFILEINNIKIVRFLERNFPEIFFKSNDARVPKKIINSDSSEQTFFIRGFADAGGSVTNIIKICSFSNGMLEDMRHLLSLQGIPSNIKSDNTICMNTNYSINEYLREIGFSIDYKQTKLQQLAKESKSNKQDLMPVTPDILRNILQQSGMFGRIHKSPKLSEILPMCLLDLFRRKKGYATKNTVIKLLNFLRQRREILINNLSNTSLYALRQLLSLTRKEISISTGLQVHQIQQIEENKLLEQEYVNILSLYIKEKLSQFILQTEQNIKKIQNLLSLNVTWEKITKINEKENPYPYLVDIETEHKNFIAGNIVVHNSGLIPYLFKMGYRGPVYTTAPTRDISALLALDFIGVAYKQAATPLFSSTDVKEMVKHTICLNYNEVTDIAPDVRITFYNSGHALGSALIHLNIGNGAHNLLYSGDFKYTRTKLLDRAIANFPRLETMIIEATYGGKANVLPLRKESEEQLINEIRQTIEKGGKVLIPELGLGRAQETMLILEEAMRNKQLPEIPIYIDGMIWDINGIHTAYPDFLNSQVRREVFQDNNPFVSEIFKRVGSPLERKEVIEGGPCVVLATSGMLVGGASVEYLRHFAPNKKNKLCFVCYQGQGSLGRQVQDGVKQIQMNVEGKDEVIDINLEVITIEGFSAHAGRNELLEFANRTQPRANKIIINHGEQSRCLDLASSIYKLHHIETNVPRNLETIRLR